MTTPDLLYVTFIVIALVLDHLVLWRGFLQRSRADPHRARLWIWSAWMIMLWTLVGAGAALWLWKDRDWASLGLIVPHGWRLWGAIVLVSALVIMYIQSVAKVARSPRDRLLSLRKRLGDLAVLLPHTRSEVNWFGVLSVTAGICEEFIFRGYLIWAFTPALGLWGAAALQVVVFALAHSYQGATGIVKTGVVGSVLTLIVLTFESLWPAIALHALVDNGSGVIGWLLLRDALDEGDMVAEPGEST